MFTDFCIRTYVNLTSGLRSASERVKDQSGAGAAEYLLILGIIAVIVAAVFGGQVKDGINNLADGIKGMLDGAGTDACTNAPGGNNCSK